MSSGAGSTPPAASGKSKPPRWLSLFTFALLGPAMGINVAMITLAIPSLAQYGLAPLLVGGAIGFVIGLLPARWLAVKIHEGLSDGT
jgi:hypothetical protein